ncbi:phosphoribosylglycinamide formyltransferase [Chryseolinea sp. T2]|uniref:phosphoribosylglycinamide formyltransferase n=1 Tax=Chryseolinea sp. T2 TaxID=3129255 RepID=UPI0030786D42
MKNARIAIFASGNGSNAEEIIRYFKHHPTIDVSLLLSNNPDAYALQRAENNNIPSKSFDRATYKETTLLLDWLSEANITHIVLAGFLWLIPDYLLKKYPGHIINIHPALLPKHGGKGMYGMRVHEAVKTAGDTVSGITIHLVDANYDEGKVIFQATCQIGNQDTPEQIASKVHALEYQHFPRIIESWIL